jgi:glycosyltransferase involved in cell wall biosynthesis
MPSHRNSMAIHVYTLAWNEEAIMPFFLDYYARFADKIVVFDLYSTDHTAQIVDSYSSSTPLVQRITPASAAWRDTLSDRRNLRLKSSCYKQSRGAADFVIVCDADEFYYHPRMNDVLAEYISLGVNVPLIQGYQMIAEKFPTTFPITQEVKRGVRFPQLDKLGVFDPALDLAWSVGFHKLNTTQGVRHSSTADIKLLHYKFLSKHYAQQRHQTLAKRRSLWNRLRGWGRHYTVGDETVSQWFDEHWLESTDII